MAVLPKGRVIGIDAGTVRTGVAISDTDGFLASALCTIKANGLRALASEIVAKATENNVRLIVIGHPINMNGTEGPRSEKIKAFADYLREKSGIEVILYDERLSTANAHVMLNITGTHGQKRKEIIDEMSACLILQSYLDSPSSIYKVK